MVSYTFLAYSVCKFCGKDFESINRHKWRYKLRSHQSSSNSNVAIDNANSNNFVNPEIINNRSIANVEYIICSCGKQCKGLRGLKAHKRSCRVIKSMSDNSVDNLENDYNELNDDNNFYIYVDNNLLNDTTNECKKTKLLTSTNDWDITNTYFHSNLATSEISEKDTEETFKHVNETIYNYFKDIKIILD